MYLKVQRSKSTIRAAPVNLTTRIDSFCSCGDQISALTCLTVLRIEDQSQAFAGVYVDTISDVFVSEWCAIEQRCGEVFIGFYSEHLLSLKPMADPHRMKWSGWRTTTTTLSNMKKRLHFFTVFQISKQCNESWQSLETYRVNEINTRCVPNNIQIFLRTKKNDLPNNL